MKTRYVVAVKPPDDHPGAVRLFGTWESHSGAHDFCELVRANVERMPEDIADESTGYAYVMTIEPRVQLDAAVKWATRGERS